MASELAQLLTEMAERGEWRGPEATMAAARTELDATRTGLLPEPRRPSGWKVALAAAAVVLVLVGGVALLLTRADSGDVTCATIVRISLGSKSSCRMKRCSSSVKSICLSLSRMVPRSWSSMTPSALAAAIMALISSTASLCGPSDSCEPTPDRAPGGGGGGTATPTGDGGGVLLRIAGLSAPAGGNADGEPDVRRAGR